MYGTLQFGEIMTAVAGGTFGATPVTLEGYARYCVADAPYPGIAPAPEARVDGLLYTGLGPRELARIDAFEGDLYERGPVTVRDASGQERPAETYIVRPDRRAELIDAPWDPDAFARRWHDVYLRGFRAGANP